MTKDRIYDEPGRVTVEDGVIHLDGPDAVDVKLTIEAAEQISDDLLHGAMKARGQVFFAAKRKPGA